MGNCLQLSAKMDTAQNSRTTSEGEILSSPNPKAFTFNELKKATKNFRDKNLIGEGGFGRVYKGWIDLYTCTASKPGSGIAVAVKKLSPDYFKGDNHQWLIEVTFLGQLHHFNLVKLIGYCVEGKNNRLLVFEFMPKGSLDNHLFRRGAQSLPWSVRMKVAIGAARGLSFLHRAKSQVIYCNFKSSDILLDDEFNARLTALRLVKECPSGDEVAGIQDYAAPEYMVTGRFTATSDVYNFGVVLLELLSGRRAFGNARATAGQDPVKLVMPYLSDKRRLFRIMDSKLGDRYPQQAAYMVADLTLRCLKYESKARPPMTEVLTTLEHIEALINNNNNIA